jgi:hypothetical protein
LAPRSQTSTPFVWLISHQPAVFFSQNKPATSNQPPVLFSQNKPAPAISHQPSEQAAGWESEKRNKKYRKIHDISFTEVEGHKHNFVSLPMFLM